jgi:hypothetical protein
MTPWDLFLTSAALGYLAGQAFRLYRTRVWRQGFDAGTRAVRVLEKVRAEQPVEALS